MSLAWLAETDQNNNNQSVMRIKKFRMNILYIGII